MPEVHGAEQAQAEGVAAEGVADVAESFDDVARDDDVVGQVLQSGYFPADVSIGPKPPPITPGGLVAGLLRGRIGDLGLQTLGPKQPGAQHTCCSTLTILAYSRSSSSESLSRF